MRTLLNFLEEQTEIKSQKKTFKWCLQPLILCFNLLGIPLANSSINNRQNSSFRSLFKLRKGVGILLFLVNLGRLLTLISFMILESFTTTKKTRRDRPEGCLSLLICLTNLSSHWGVI